MLMTIHIKLPEQSFRNTPGLNDMLLGSQSRHFDDAEYARYLEMLPNQKRRVDAARDLMSHEEMIVKRTVLEIMQLYPYQSFHVRAPEKCIRDVTYISIYSTHAMLVNDNDWYRDKLLYWFRTMLQSFNFPPIGNNTTVLNRYPDISVRARGKPEHIASIYDTYSRLRLSYQQVLQPESWRLLDEPLQVALDVLTLRQH
jgi:hypothetical protein